MKTKLANQILDSFIGYFSFMRICGNNHVRLLKDYVLILPGQEKNICHYMLIQLDRVLGHDIFNGDADVFVITDDQSIADEAVKTSKRIKNVIKVSDKRIRQIVVAYCMFRFELNVIVGMLEHLQARGNAERLAILGVSEAEISANALYALNLREGA